MTERASWEFEEGAEIRPGRHAVQRLGGGSRYEVYLAVDATLMSLVVVKLLRPDRAGDVGALEDLHAEARALTTLSHPSLVRMFDAQLDGERPHLVLEYIEGPTLRRLMKRYGVLSLEQLLPLALHVCSALHYLETQDMVHLDVKPDNIMMAAPPRLIDLSIARTIDHARALRTAVGTYAYMAPEQCVPGSAPIGFAADVWGLGVTLYQAATGTLPFPSSSEIDPDLPARDLPQVHDDPRWISEDLPDEFATVVMRCLERDPVERPRAADVAMALQPVIEAMPHSIKLRFRRSRV